jgi:large subunit ribosomal protein L17
LLRLSSVAGLAESGQRKANFDSKEANMRHLKAGWKLGRNTSHRRALLRNLVTSLIVEERIETSVVKAKAMRPHVEKMITLGKRGDLAARRQAGAFLMTRESVDKLWELAPRFGDRNGGYLRIIRTGFQQGDGAEKAFVELIGSEKKIEAKRKKRAESRAKRAEETRKAMEQAESEAQQSGGEEAGDKGKE